MNPAVEEIAALVRQGNKLEAIKRLRQVSGLGLKDAHDLIENDPSHAALERVVRRLPASAAAPGAGIGSPEVRRLVAEGKTIEAIKQLREETGLGLRQAKDLVDAMKPSPAVAPPGEGLPMKWIVAAVVAAAACGALYLGGIGPG